MRSIPFPASRATAAAALRSALGLGLRALGLACVPIAFMDVVGRPARVTGPSMQPTLNGGGAAPPTHGYMDFTAASALNGERPLRGQQQADHTGLGAPVCRPPATPDIVWLSRWTHHTGRPPQPGDIYAFISPRDPSRVLVKRVLAGPGDPVPTGSDHKQLTIVPAGHYWMVSDNKNGTITSNNSSDNNKEKAPLLVVPKKTVAESGATQRHSTDSQPAAKFVPRHQDSELFGPVSGGLLVAPVAWIIWPPSRWTRLYG